MPRARHGKLTDTYVESLPPKEGRRERIVRDGVLPGFLIRVGPRKRTFELRIEKPPKTTRPLGHWPDFAHLMLVGWLRNFGTNIDTANRWMGVRERAKTPSPVPGRALGLDCSMTSDLKERLVATATSSTAYRTKQKVGRCEN